MKIGFLITYFYPFGGGAESNCLALALELAKKGHEVHVFTSDRKDGKTAKKEETYEGIKIHRFRTLFRYKYYFAFYPSILKILSYNLDVLHVHAFGFPQHDLVIMLEKLKGTKLVCTPHGPFMALKNYSKPAQMANYIYMPIIKFINSLYDKIIEVNPYQYSWMKYAGVDKKQVAFVPNGISKEAFRKVEIDKYVKKYNLNGKFVISYLGRIQEYKGLDQIIKIMPELLKKNKDIIFLAIGKDAGDSERLKKIAEKLNLKNVIFTGEVSEEEKLALLTISEIFAFPSEWEAFGISLLEAMARGNAVISSGTEGGKFLVDKNAGFVYKFNNLSDLRKKTLMLITNSKLREKMQQNNIKKAKLFLWSIVVKDLEKMYKEI